MIEVKQPALLERYQRLIEISRNLASTLNLENLLNQIVHAAADLCNAQAASILLYDSKKRELYFSATSNLAEPLMRGLTVPVESSLAGWIVTHREPIIIADAQSDPRHFSGVARSTNITTTSLLGVPLINKEEVVGALEAINKLEGGFSQEDLEVLTALGSMAAVAIENARLFQQSDLISVLVHELRTPLTSINMATRLLLRPETSTEMRENMTWTILDETNRLSEMTTAFLDLARIESGRMQFQVQHFDVLPVLEGCVRMMQARALERGIQIDLEARECQYQIKADPDKIKQVFLNLLHNAVKYNRPEGKITIKVDAEDELRVSFADTGPGIPEESLPHLFEKFYRVPGTEKAAQGTGLGLSICQRIIEAHGGRIEAQSEVGAGSTFTVFLPLEKSC